MTEKDRLIIDTRDDFDSEDYLMEMANLRGSKVRVPHKLKFSFYFSGRNTSHGIRVKPVFTPDELVIDKVGILKLCDDWKFTPYKGDKHISSKDIKEMKDFFREYKVLFAGVWEKRIHEDDVQDFFRGMMPLKELIENMKDYKEYKEYLDKVDSIKELEQTVRKYNIFNMND